VQTLEKGGAVKDYSTRKAQLLDLLRAKLGSCAVGEKTDDWRAAVEALLSEVRMLQPVFFAHSSVMSRILSSIHGAVPVGNRD
jgi:hypothetical protein